MNSEGLTPNLEQFILASSVSVTLLLVEPNTLLQNIKHIFTISHTKNHTVI